MRPGGAARAHAAGAALACAIPGERASLPIGAWTSLRRADSAAIDARLVLIPDRVAAGIPHARSAAGVESRVAGDEHASGVVTGPDAVRVQRRAVDAALATARTLAGDTHVAGADVLRIARGQRA